jgi:hypothetical protein
VIRHTPQARSAILAAATQDHSRAAPAMQLPTRKMHRWLAGRHEPAIRERRGWGLQQHYDDRWPRLSNDALCDLALVLSRVPQCTLSDPDNGLCVPGEDSIAIGHFFHGFNPWVAVAVCADKDPLPRFGIFPYDPGYSSAVALKGKRKIIISDLRGHSA